MLEHTDPFAEWEHQMEDQRVIGAVSDGLHLFYGVLSAIASLGADEVNDQLMEENERLSLLQSGIEGAIHFDDDRVVDQARLEDWVADTAKRAGELLGEWLHRHDLKQVALWVYLPCHKQFALVQYTARAA